MRKSTSTWYRLDRQVFTLLLACSISGLVSAECAPSPIAVKIRNITLSNGHVARGLAISVGTPAQDFAFFPQWPMNNTLIYGTNGFCTERAPTAEGGCTTYRGGQYSMVASKTRKLPSDAQQVDGSPFPEATFVTDAIKLSDNVSLADFPLGIALNDWNYGYGTRGWHTMMAFGMGTNSTLLRVLVSSGKIVSHTWSMFYGWTGANSNTQLDGTFVFGGYDKAKVIGPGYTQSLTTHESCPSRVQVVIEDIKINFPSGLTTRIFPESRPHFLTACIVPDLPLLMQMPLDPYFDEFQNRTNTTMTFRSQGLAYGSIIYGPDAEPFDGDMTFTLQGGFSIRVPNSQIVVPDRRINNQTGELQSNGSAPTLLIYPALVGDPMEVAQLGRHFLSAAYLMVNQDAGKFTLWEANPTTDEDLVSVDTKGASITDSCDSGASKLSSDTPGRPGPSVGTILGGTIGTVAVISLAVFITFYIRRRSRYKSKRLQSEIAATPPSKLDSTVVIHECDSHPVSPSDDLSSVNSNGKVVELPPETTLRHELPINGMRTEENRHELAQ